MTQPLDDHARKLKIASDPLAMMVEQFAESDAQELEFVCPEPGTVVDGKRFLDITSINPETMYHRIYDVVNKLGYMKTKVWVRKQGRSTWLYKYDPKAVK